MASNMTLPRSGERRAMMRRRRVDFPQPLGPINAVVRPGLKSRSVGCSAMVPPKLLLTPINRTSGSMANCQLYPGALQPATGCRCEAGLAPRLQGCEVKNCEKFFRIGPNSRKLETGRGGKGAETFDGMFVGELGDDFFA